MRQTGTSRRNRLRPARRRPTPSRVGARERAGEAEAISRLGGLNLLTLGAVVTIVASMGSLATTGIGDPPGARWPQSSLPTPRSGALMSPVAGVPSASP